MYKTFIEYRVKFPLGTVLQKSADKSIFTTKSDDMSFSLFRFYKIGDENPVV